MNTLPKVRLLVGWVAFLCAISSDTVALISSRGRGSSRSSTPATTAPGPSAERRYERASWSSVTQSAPSAVATSARATMSDQSRPYAPAFILTPPPTVPGMAQANSKPPRPASRARWRQTAFVAPPPAARPGGPTSTAASSPSRWITSASTPSSATSRFEPSPTTTISRLFDCRVAECLAELVERPRPSERARRPARADRRELRERDAALDGSFGQPGRRPRVRPSTAPPPRA